MPTQEEVVENLETVLVPGVMRSLVKMNLVRDISITDRKIVVKFASAALASETQKWLRDNVKDVSKKLTGVNEVSVATP